MTTPKPISQEVASIVYLAFASDPSVDRRQLAFIRNKLHQYAGINEEQQKRDKDCAAGRHFSWTSCPDDADYMECRNCGQRVHAA
jgi:hypothetical protein